MTIQRLPTKLTRRTASNSGFTSLSNSLQRYGKNGPFRSLRGFTDADIAASQTIQCIFESKGSLWTSASLQHWPQVWIAAALLTAHKRHSSGQAASRCSFTEPDFRYRCEIWRRSNSRSADKAVLGRLHFCSQNLEACGAKSDSECTFKPAAKLQVDFCHGLRRKE